MRAGRAAPGAGHLHAIRTQLLEADIAEVADHVRQMVAARIGNLVEKLLGDGADRHQAAGVRRLGDDRRAIGPAFGDRVADIRIVADFTPVGEDPAARLGAAFEHMTDQRSRGEEIVLLRPPTEFVNEGAEAERAVDDAAGDDEVGAQRQRAGNREGAEIGIDRRVAGAFRQLGFEPAGFAEFRRPLDHIVAIDDRDLDVEAAAPGGLADRRGAAARIDRAGIGDDLYLLGGEIAPGQGDDLVGEAGDVTGLPIALPAASGVGHEIFGQIIQHQIIELAAAQQLRDRDDAVAKPGAAAADPDHALRGHQPGVRQVLNVATSSCMARRM